MSTRGIWGFIANGEEYLSYNHSDSYPEWLGKNLLDWAKSGNFSIVSERIAKRLPELKVVQQTDIPTPEEAEALAEFANDKVSTGEDFYSVLRNCQGDPEATLRSGYWVDGKGFESDSLFCEWGYIFDLDTGFFEIYEGFQKEPHSEGRFADRVVNGELGSQYFPIRLVAAYSLGELPTEENFLKDVLGKEEVEA